MMNVQRRLLALPGVYVYNFASAKAKCESYGYRLCHKDEIMHKRICMRGWTSTGEQGYPMSHSPGSGCGHLGWNSGGTNKSAKANGFCCHK